MADMEVGVHTGQMDSDVKSLENQIGKLRADAQRLQSEMENMNRMWEGAANDVMRLRFQADYEDIQALFRLLEGMKQDLETMKKEYESCDNLVGDVVRNLSVL